MKSSVWRAKPQDHSRGGNPVPSASSALWHTRSLSWPVSRATESSPEVAWQLANSFSWGSGVSPFKDFKSACSWWKLRSLPAQACGTTLKWAHLINFFIVCRPWYVFGGVGIHLCSHHFRNMILKFKQNLAFWVTFRIILHLDIRYCGDSLCIFAYICLDWIWDK